MLKAGMLDRDYEHEIEERNARGLVFALTRQDIAPERLDVQGIPATHGKKPDFKFVLDGDQTCFVEVTRLLPPMLRQVEAFAEQHICDPVKGNLPGTFTLSFSIDSLARRGIPGGHAEAIVDDLRRRLHHDPSAVPQLFEPITGYAIRKIDDVGSRLIPWVVAEELPSDLAADDPRALLLRDLYIRTVLEANEKLSSRPGRCVLLIDVSQSGLDNEFHVMAPGVNPSLMTAWTNGLPPAASNIHEIYVEPGIGVWESPEPGKWQRVRAGTRHTDQPRGFYIRLRPQPTKPV